MAARRSPAAAATLGLRRLPGLFAPLAEHPDGELVRGLKPQAPVDFLALHKTRSIGVATDFSVGEKCSGASDVASCSKSVDAATMPVSSTMPPGMGAFFLEQCVQVCETGLLIATRKDDVIVLSNAMEVRAFLGSMTPPRRPSSSFA